MRTLALALWLAAAPFAAAATVDFEVAGLTCEGCVTTATDALRKLPGVTKASVDLQSSRARVESTRVIPADEIRTALAKFGFEARFAGDDIVTPLSPAERVLSRFADWYTRKNADARSVPHLFSVAFGVTTPIGRTEENPYLLGEQGVEHLHIQFGSGTFDPVLEATYAFRVTPSATAGAYAAGRFPLYENARGFRAPFDASIGVSASHVLSDRITARAEVGAYYQSYGAWDGVRDPNTGLFSTSVLAGASAAFEHFFLGVDIRVPVTKRTLSEGDAFRQGPTIVVTVQGIRLR